MQNLSQKHKARRPFAPLRSADSARKSGPSMRRKSASLALAASTLLLTEVSAGQDPPTAPPVDSDQAASGSTPDAEQSSSSDDNTAEDAGSKDNAPSEDPAQAPVAEEPAATPVTKATAAKTPINAEQKREEAALPSENDSFSADEDDEMEFEAVAEVEAPPREPTKHTIEREQLTRIPGTRGDALRAVEILPGVGRSGFGENDDAPLLRGSSSWDSIVVLDGAEVPLMYHFGGLTSFFNSYLLEEVNLYPGNYSARYGRASAGVVEARVRDPLSKGFHAMLEVSAIDSFALVEGGLTDKTSLALAARRSNIDLFFSAFVPDGAYSILAAPVYWDYQAILAHRFNESHKLRVMTFGSHDKMEFYLSDSAPDDPALRGDVQAKLGFDRLQVELENKFSETLSHQLMVSAGPNITTQKLGSLDAHSDFWEFQARSDWAITATDWMRIDTGIDFKMFGGKGTYTGPVPSTGEGETGSGALAGEDFVSIEETDLAPILPAAFAEASIRPTDDLLLIPGVRTDYSVEGNDWTVDPRFSARYTVSKETTVKGGVGYYSQPPEYWEIMEDLGNPDLKPFRTLQTSLGFEQTLSEHANLDLEGFYKDFQDLPVGTEGGAPPRFLNEGEGRAYGMEVLFELRLSAKTQAFAAYTLSRSERKDGDAGPWRLFDFDQTHNLSLTANYDLGKGWLAGARFRLVSGNPYSPAEGAVYDASSDTYRPLFSSVNSERNPLFHQLDVRVEKLWNVGPVDLTTYLEIMNVYNAQNQNGYAYSFDYTESEGAIGMPFFPNLGIRGEL